MLIKNSPKSYENYYNWSQHKNFYCTKFEDLVGSKGGGDDKKQINEVLNIAKHLGINLTAEKAKNVALKLFGNTGTFRKGKIGSWKTEFTQQHKKEFKQFAGKLLIDLGYEKSLNW